MYHKFKLQEKQLYNHVEEYSSGAAIFVLVRFIDFAFNYDNKHKEKFVTAKYMRPLFTRFITDMGRKKSIITCDRGSRFS